MQPLAGIAHAADNAQQIQLIEEALLFPVNFRQAK